MASGPLTESCCQWASETEFPHPFWEDQFTCLPLDFVKQMLCGVQDNEAVLFTVSCHVASITMTAPGCRETGHYQTLRFGSAGP